MGCVHYSIGGNDLIRARPFTKNDLLSVFNAYKTSFIEVQPNSLFKIIIDSVTYQHLFLAATLWYLVLFFIILFKVVIMIIMVVTSLTNLLVKDVTTISKEDFEDDVYYNV